MAGPFFGVHGDRVVGPFHNLQHAKQALNIPTNVHNDEVIVRGTLYRYGAAFVGITSELVKRNLMQPQPGLKATHVRVQYGRLMSGGLIQMEGYGSWSEIPQ